MHNNQDRRTKRTRQNLHDALLALLKKKRYEDISVQDIVERADIARSTFYVHYTDKDDLLTGRAGVFASSLAYHAEMMSQPEKKPATIYSARGWFFHIQAQKDILKIIGKDSAADLAMKTLHEILRNDVYTKMQKHVSDNHSAPASLIVDYMTSSLVALVGWWIKQDMADSPERMDEMFQQLVMPGIYSVIDN